MNYIWTGTWSAREVVAAKPSKVKLMQVGKNSVRARLRSLSPEALQAQHKAYGLL